jgi:hypothetical protein
MNVRYWFYDLEICMQYENMKNTIFCVSVAWGVECLYLNICIVGSITFVLLSHVVHWVYINVTLKYYVLSYVFAKTLLWNKKLLYIF